MAGRPNLFDFTARLWLRAYPRRWRATYGTDLLGTLADVATEGARTVPIREGLAVLRAGWALRWREHPPFWPWVGYRFFNRRLPGRYRYWVIDDLIGPLYDVRVYLATLPVVSGPLLIQSLLTSTPPPWEFLVALVAWFVFLLLVSMALKLSARWAWDKHVGGMYPTEILPLRRRRQVRRAARSRS